MVVTSRLRRVADVRLQRRSALDGRPLVMIWSAMKFIVMGPVSLLLLVRTKATQARGCRRGPIAVEPIGAQK